MKTESLIGFYLTRHRSCKFAPRMAEVHRLFANHAMVSTTSVAALARHPLVDLLSGIEKDGLLRRVKRFAGFQPDGFRPSNLTVHGFLFHNQIPHLASRFLVGRWVSERIDQLLAPSG